MIRLGVLAVIIRNIYKIKIAYDFTRKRLFINENAFTTSTRNFEGLTVLKTPILELIIELLVQVLRKGSGAGVGNW